VRNMQWAELKWVHTRDPGQANQYVSASHDSGRGCQEEARAVP